MRKIIYFYWVPIIFLILGCVSQKIQRIYRSVPPVQKISNPVFDAQIKSLKLENPFYVAFQLTIKNHSAAPLAIVWNETRYFHKDQDLGVFVFNGIDPESVKKGIPKELIPAGETLSRQISPFRTLTFFRRERVPRPGQSNFYAGILPGGTNTVMLVMSQDTNIWREPLSVKLLSKEAPKK